MMASFFSEGYVRCSEAVPTSACVEALREVNRSLGEATPAGVQRDKVAWSSVAITRLFNDSAALRAAVGQLLGHDNLVPFLPAAQVALRFPGTLCLPGTYEPVPWWSSAFHIDGLPSSENGVAVGDIRNFTLLVGVCLQDVLADFAGNLVVYPRSHHVMERYFRQHGFDAAKRGLVDVPALPLAEPVQLHLKRGDAVLAHYSLCHSIAPNCTADIRYMVYFRVNVRGDGFHPDAMTDLWRDYSPVFRRLHRDADTAPPPPPTTTTTSVRSAGYIDALVRSSLAEQLARDQAAQEERQLAERLFDEQRWHECRPMLCRLSDARPDDVLLCLKAGLSATAADKQHLLDGAARLRRLTGELAPNFASAWVWLARNLQRQAAELQLDTAAEALACASRALLHLSAEPDVAVEAVRVLVDLDAPAEQLAAAVAAVKQRHPALAERVDAAAAVDPCKALWKDGQRWLASPDPKDLAAGLRIFGRLVELAAADYWAHVLYAACLLWSAQPARCLPVLQSAEQIDPLYPHAYVVAAQALKVLDRSDDAVHCLARLFAHGAAIKCHEPDHFQKIVEAVQLAADCLLPDQPLVFAQLQAQARALFPDLAAQIDAVKKQDAQACSIA